MRHNWLDRLLPSRVRKSLRTKLVLVYAAVISAIALLTYFQSVQNVHRHSHRETANKAQKIAAITAYSVSPAVLFRDSAAAEDVIAAARQGDDVAYVVITDANQEVINAWREQLAVKAGFASISADPVADDWGVYRVRQAIADQRGNVIGHVFLGVWLDELHVEVAAARRAIGLLSLALFLGGLLAVYLLTHWLTAPLTAVVATTKRIADGDLSARAAAGGEDEVGILSGAMNVMVEKLATAYATLQEANHALEARVVSRTEELHREERERARAEVAMVQSERRFRTMFESSVIGVALFELDGTFVESNRSLAVMLGRAADELPALSFDDLTDPEHTDAARLHFHEITTGAATSVQLEAILRSAAPQTVWGHMVLSAVTDESGPRYVIVMIEDISEQKRLAEMYRESQKLEAVGRLAGGVAHDFNNLLTTINGISDLMLSEIDPDSPFHDDLCQILDAGRRAAGLTRQLLAFGRKQVLKPALINVNAVLAEMGGLIPRVVGEDVRFTFNPQPGLPVVKVDKTQLEQVIMNLLVNARDAMPSGGSVLIETQTAHITGHEAHAYGVTAGEYVKISVTDTGTGMDQATLDRAFEPFFTTKPLGKGTGLGLATVYGIVKQSGGGIRVDSEPGAGTTFHIAFPAQLADADAILAEPEPAADSGAETVLVVEDEDTVRALFVRVLRRAGYDVLEARHGLEALMMSEEHAGEIDIMVTDVIMPGMNGPEAVKRLLRRRPRLKVLYISGYTEDLVLQQGAGKTLNHLQKPVSPATLCLAVRQVLDDSRELRPRHEIVKLVV